MRPAARPAAHCATTPCTLPPPSCRLPAWPAATCRSRPSAQLPEVPLGPALDLLPAPQPTDARRPAPPRPALPPAGLSLAVRFGTQAQQQGDVGRVMVVLVTDGRANVSLAKSNDVRDCSLSFFSLFLSSSPSPSSPSLFFFPSSPPFLPPSLLPPSLLPPSLLPPLLLQLPSPGRNALRSSLVCCMVGWVACSAQGCAQPAPPVHRRLASSCFTVDHHPALWTPPQTHVSSSYCSALILPYGSALILPKRGPYLQDPEALAPDAPKPSAEQLREEVRAGDLLLSLRGPRLSAPVGRSAASVPAAASGRWAGLGARR